MSSPPMSKRTRKKLRSAVDDSSSDEETLGLGGINALLPPPITAQGGPVQSYLPPLQSILPMCIPPQSVAGPDSTVAPQGLISSSETQDDSGSTHLTPQGLANTPIAARIGQINLPLSPKLVVEPLLQRASPAFLANLPKIVPINQDLELALDTNLFFLNHEDDSEMPHFTSPPVPSPATPPASPTASTPSSPEPVPTETGSPGLHPTSDLHSSPSLFEGSPLTVHDCMVSILTYSQTNHLSGSSTSELITLLSLLLPQPNNLPKTSHLFKQYFKNETNPLHLYYFCSHCWSSRTSFNDICDNPQCTAPNRKISYFVTCSIESQLQKMYAREGFLEKLKYRHTRVKENPSNIEDIYDGNLYKEEEKEFLSNSNNISLTWYSDGVAIYECSSYSMWPVIYTINELPCEDRHKVQNILIGGLWGADSKPHPNVFLLPQYHEMVKLRNGVNIQPFGSDSILVCVKLLFGTCDMPAKATFMNMKCHNAYTSCPRCFIKGEKSDRTGNVMVFPHSDNLELRTDNNFHHCVTEAVKSKDGYMGVWGPSVLSFMFGSSFIRGMANDVMHSVYMGCTKQFLRLWFDPKYKGEPFSLVEKIPTVNRRLTALKLPHFVQRLPVDVDKNLCYVKASLCRNLFFYILLVVLRDILPQKYYDNFSKLVEGVAQLNKSSISAVDLETGNTLLHQFSKDFQNLYGLRHMTANIHSVLHLAQCVADIGNLFHMSCFRFEDLNGLLCALVHGTRHAISQISANLTLLQDLPLLVNNVSSELVKTYCKKLLSKSKTYPATEIIDVNVYVVGSITDVSVHSTVTSELVKTLYGDTYAHFRYFDKLYKCCYLFVSSSYKQGTRNSTICKYKCSDFLYHGRILTFVKVSVTNSVKYLALIQRSADVAIEGLPRHVEFCPTDDVDLININQLISVAFSLTVDDHNYIVDPLNKCELE